MARSPKRPGELSRLHAEASEHAHQVEADLARNYARVAADPAGRHVLADIINDLADQGFDSARLRLGSHSDGFSARYAAASRIQRLIDQGRKGG